MRLPRAAIIAIGFILPAFALALTVATRPGTHATLQQHISLKPVTSTSQVKGTSTAQVTELPTSAQAAQTAYATTAHKQLSTTPQTPSTSTATNNTPAPSSTGPSQTPDNNQPSGEQTIELHVGGYPPATGAALTPDFENPTYVSCGGQYPNNTYCPISLYQWVATKYCIFTYADGHTVNKGYQYLAYDGRYANPDGSLGLSGVNMAITSNPTYSCNVDSAPKSVFEPSYTY